MADWPARYRLVGYYGESLGEHREQQHGFFLYDATLQIPMIFAGPTIAPRVVSDQVRIVDVLPTVVETVGLRTPADVQGESLSPALAGRPLHLIALEETWYPRLHFGWSELTAIRDGRYKFILAPRPELYRHATGSGRDARSRVSRSGASRSDGAHAQHHTDAHHEDRVRKRGT